MPVALIPFSIFFACCAAQFFFMERVKRALSARHPDVLQGLLGKSFFANNALVKFTWRRRDLDLNDPDLTKTVKQFKALLFVAYGAWGLCALALFSGVGLRPIPLPWLPGHAVGPAVHVPPEAIGVEPNLRFPGVSLPFGVVFAAAFVGNATYLLLAWRLSARWNSARLGAAWRLSARWNSARLGATAALADPLSVLGVIWWSKPATRDKPFLRLRVVTRTVFILAAVGTFTVLGLTFRIAL